MNKFTFSYNVPVDNTLTNDPSLSLLIEVSVLSFRDGTNYLNPSVTGADYTSSMSGKRERMPDFSLALAIRVKDWYRLYQDVSNIAERRYQNSLKKNVAEIAEEHYKHVA